MISNTQTREDWLNRAITHLRPMFDDCEVTLPEQIQASLGFPKVSKHLGECWMPHAHEDEVTTSVIISPVVKTSVEVLDILCHELVHAALPKAGHRKPFTQACDRVGLTEGPAKSRHAGIDLLSRLKELDDILGEFPSIPISLKKKESKKPKKEGI